MTIQDMIDQFEIEGPIRVSVFDTDGEEKSSNLYSAAYEIDEEVRDHLHIKYLYPTPKEDSITIEVQDAE